MVEFSVNWEDPALKRWLDPMTMQSTKWVYRSAFKAYTYFTDMSASSLIDEACEVLPVAQNGISERERMWRLGGDFSSFFFAKTTASIVRVANRGAIRNGGNSGISPFSSVLTNQKS
jgi:hypothetical protein